MLTFLYVCLAFFMIFFPPLSSFIVCRLMFDGGIKIVFYMLLHNLLSHMACACVCVYALLLCYLFIYFILFCSLLLLRLFVLNWNPSYFRLGLLDAFGWENEKLVVYFRQGLVTFEGWNVVKNWNSLKTRILW